MFKPKKMWTRQRLVLVNPLSDPGRVSLSPTVSLGGLKAGRLSVRNQCEKV